MALSQNEIAAQMIAQLRLIDPSASAEVGTPERKIIDTVAQQNADSQVDLNALRQALSLDGKYGAALDRFLNLFNFSRIKAQFATGYVVFSRNTPSTLDILVPANTQVATAGGTAYRTTFAITLAAGDLETAPVPIQALLSGEASNIAAELITQFIGSQVSGITGVTNKAPVTGGKSQESDDEYKLRFRNTVFRNLAGTEDQFLALAVATSFSTKANVIGPVSRYREYIQIPTDDDTVGGNGITAGEYTTALSTIPYAKELWPSLPTFISNDKSGLETIFYREEVDYRFNYDDATRNKGDAYRLDVADLGPAVTDGIWPNITFLNVYTGANVEVKAARPGDVLLAEFSYLSDASRNSIEHNVSNAVDVYVDGSNTSLASTVTVPPTTASVFVDNPISKYHYENYRRIGQPTKRPLLGNVLMPLFWQPVSDVPAQIVVDTNTYIKNVHYWGVEDVSSLRGTTAARGGIEWSTNVPGKLIADPDEGPYTGEIITTTSADSLEIDDYSYDKNIVDLQAALVGSKQTTTDVLGHRAAVRYFKLDITVMYTPGASIPETNLAIAAAVDRFLKGQYFGSAIQLSDLLQVVHDIPGVDNVRWSSDIPDQDDLIRVIETDRFGVPLTGASADVIQLGNGLVHQIEGLYLVGEATEGHFQVERDGDLSAPIDATSPTLLADIDAAVSALTGYAVSTTEDVRSAIDTNPIRSFRIEYPAVGARVPFTVVNQVDTFDNFSGGPYVLNADFFLRDNELASLPEAAYVPLMGIADTVPGLIIRPRAQNTWNR